MERLAKLLSLVAIPVVLAVVGWFIQNSLAERNVSQEYVKLAVTILKEPKDKTDALLRSWAADLLNQNSPTKFSPDVLRALKEGQATLPAQLAAILGTAGGGGAVAVAPDGKTMATGHADGTVRTWDIETGAPRATLRAHQALVSGIAFAPDGRRLLTTSLDKTARVWDLASGTAVGPPLLGHTDGLVGGAFSPDGSTVFTRSLDGTVLAWSTVDGRLRSRFRVPE
jgi:WD40 repeat protein